MNKQMVAIAWINLFFGALLWFGFSTDYSWRGVVADWVFVAFVCLVGVISVRFRKRIADTRSRRRFVAACMPSLVGGAIAALIQVLFIIPPFTLGLIFSLQEARMEKLLQVAPSPDETLVAYVRFRPVGAYASGSGRVFVDTIPRIFPFVEHEVQYVRRSYADPKDEKYLEWRDSTTLRILGEPDYGQKVEREVNVNQVGWHTPYVIAMPITLVRMLAALFGHGP